MYPNPASSPGMMPTKAFQPAQMPMQPANPVQGEPQGITPPWLRPIAGPQSMQSGPQRQLPAWAQHLSPMMQKAMFGQPYSSPFSMTRRPEASQNALAQPSGAGQRLGRPMNALAMWGR